jgi:hypothetical protein
LRDGQDNPEEDSMNPFHESFASRHVTIVSGAGMTQERTDTGTVVTMTDNWIQLAKDNGEMLLFPATSVRVVKLLDVEPQYTVEKRDLPSDSMPPIEWRENAA